MPMLTRHDNNAVAPQTTFFYGWVIVAAGAILIAMSAGLRFAFAVFFKPLVVEFGWSRADTSGIQSIGLITSGILAIPIGWLADRFGPAKVLTFCSLMVGLGFVLSSQVTALWQLYVTYGLIGSIGFSGPFSIGIATTARWFIKHRGLALGIVSAGVGLGTLIMLPIAERLIAAFDWSRAYFILGVAAWPVMISCALFLRRDPRAMRLQPLGSKEPLPPLNLNREQKTGHTTLETSSTLRAAARTKYLWILISIFFLFYFSQQVVMVHLVNYATDRGISALVAASFVSVIGLGGIIGRVVMGMVSDRIGNNNALAICCTVLAVTLLWLILARELWMFYLFAIVFGFAYGGEVPQMASLAAQFFGLGSMAVLIGAITAGTAMGGALGSWVAGRRFALLHSYQMAFVAAAIASLMAIIVILLLKRIRPKTATI